MQPRAALLVLSWLFGSIRTVPKTAFSFKQFQALFPGCSGATESHLKLPESCSWWPGCRGAAGQRSELPELPPRGSS
eukprot:8804501-Alexandrium_andersonii.AAC.1